MQVLKTICATVVLVSAFILLAVLFFRVATLSHGPAIGYDVYLSIMLTALGVIVAAFTIFVGLAAIWGYAGLKDTVRDMATKEVEKAIRDTLKKYPDSADMLNTLNRLQSHAKWLDEMQNQIATQSAPKVIEPSSKDKAQSTVAEKQETPIQGYPGEEADGADNGNKRRE